MVAWGIALSTAVFGSTVFGIKAAAVAWSLGWNLLWARLMLDMYGDRRLAFWSLLALNLTLVYQVYGIGPTPDGPLLVRLGRHDLGGVARQRTAASGRWWLLAGVLRRAGSAGQVLGRAAAAGAAAVPGHLGRRSGTGCARPGPGWRC